jgi:hypothetical protein
VVEPELRASSPPRYDIYVDRGHLTDIVEAAGLAAMLLTLKGS